MLYINLYAIYLINCDQLDMYHIVTAFRQGISARATNSGTMIRLIRTGRTLFTVRYSILAISTHIARNWKYVLIYLYMHFLTVGYHANITYHNACHEDHIQPGSWKIGRYYWLFRQMHLSFLFSILRMWTFQQSEPISAHNEVI